MTSPEEYLFTIQTLGWANQNTTEYLPGILLEEFLFIIQTLGWVNQNTT